MEKTKEIIDYLKSSFQTN